MFFNKFENIKENYIKFLNPIKGGYKTDNIIPIIQNDEYFKKTIGWFNILKTQNKKKTKNLNITTKPYIYPKLNKTYSKWKFKDYRNKNPYLYKSNNKNIKIKEKKMKKIYTLSQILLNK